MASWVSPVIAVLFSVVASSSGDSGCIIECSIDREAEQDSTCVIRCVSRGQDGPSVMINGNALRTVLDCDNHSIETNPYCLLRENGITVGAKIKSSSGRTLFEYDLNTNLCNHTCEFSVEFNGPACSVVSEDLSKPCINPTVTSAHTPATSAHPTPTSPESTTTTQSGPTETPSGTPDNWIAGILGGIGGIDGIRIIAAVIAVLIAVCCCFYRKSKRKTPTTMSEHGKGEVLNVVTLKSSSVKRRK